MIESVLVMKRLLHVCIGALTFLLSSVFFINFVASTGFTVIEKPIAAGVYPDNNYGRILKGQKRSFDFQSEENNLGIIGIRFNVHQSNTDDILIFRISEKTGNRVYFENQYTTKQFVDGELYTFGFPPIPDSKGKTYSIELESVQGTREHSVGISTAEPVLVTKYKYSLSELRSNPSVLRTFLTKKSIQIFSGDGFIPTLIISLLPPILFFAYLYMSEKRKVQYRNLVRRLRNVRKDADDFFLLHKNSTFPELDGIRAWAISMVVMAHIGPWIMSLTSEHVGTTRFISDALLHFFMYVPFIGVNGGGTGVDLFFVLSGFLIVMTIQRKTPTVMHFMTKRYKRLLPVHAVLILATIPVLTIPELLLNLTFFAHLFPSVRTVNLLTWTLTYEMLFYALCAVWFITMRKKRFVHTWKFFLFFVVVLYCSQFVLQDFLAVRGILYPEMNRFIAFFFGVALAKLYFTDARNWKRLTRVFYYGSVPGLLIITVFRYSYEYVISGKKLGIAGISIDYLLLDIGIFLLVGSMLITKDHALKRFFRHKGIRIIGIISYSMYLSHYHLALPMARNLVNGIYIAPLKIISFVFLGFAVSICISIFLFHFLEKPYFTRVSKSS